MNFRITLTKDDNGTIMVTFPDFPEAATYGDDENEARLRAADALETAIEARIADREDIPAPTRAKKGESTIGLSTLMALKVELYREMRAQKVTKAKLARLLRWHAPQIDRLLDVRHHSRLDQMEAAFAALRKRISVKISANRA